VAGGCSFTLIALPVFAFISCVISAGTTLSSRGCRSQLVSCPFSGWLTFFWHICSVDYFEKGKKSANIGGYA